MYILMYVHLDGNPCPPVLYMYKAAVHVILTFELCNSKISGNSVQGESTSVDIPGRCVHLLNEYVASLWL